MGSSAGSSLPLLVHDYDSFGNLKRLAENGSNYPFTYDDQNRVIEAYNPNSGGNDYVYDSLGRITHYEGVGQTNNTTFPAFARKKSGYSYDANGNLVSRAGGQTLTWNHENQLSAISGGGLPTESYLYDDEGIRVKQTSNGVSTWYPSAIFESKRDTIWVDDSTPPAPTVIVNGEDGWNWTTSSPAPYSGSKAHVSANLAGPHQHYFYNAPAGSQITPATGEALYAYIYLDPASPPSEVMVQWHDGSGWEHRAYWGANNINAGTNGSNSRRYMGPLPATGQWVRLEVPAAAVGLENVAVKGMAFTLYGGRAWWDKAGVANNTKYYSFNGQRVAMKKGGVLTYLHGDALGSTVLETNTSGNPTADQKYYAYGKQRDTGPVVTDHKFTGQKLDSTGLMYYQSRYYDPAIGAFISPDTIVPDAGNLFSYNRYMYTVGNPLNRVDPTGHKDIAMDGGGGLGGLVGGSGFVQAVANDVFQLAVALASAAGIIAPSVEQAPSVIDGVVQMADQAAHNSAQQSAGSSNTGDPGGLDPNDPFGFNKLTNLVLDRGFENLQRDLQSLNRGNRVGAERVTEVMNQLGDQVQRLGVKDRVPGVTTSDIDILDMAGNVHEVGAHTASQLGMKFQYAQAWIAQSSNPNAQIFYWHFGEVTQDILDTAQRWNVTVQVVK